ncbi:MAG: N-acetylmuramoyl-L-alanine amidase [Firmicutes bacterium]|nr:N-acetylmuramoyl-L-alanine amidase [Bacillota bacterium]
MGKKIRVMINPSVQYGNVIRDEVGQEVYNEGENMFDIAWRVKEILDHDDRFEVYLSRDGRRAPSDLQREVDLANQLECQAFVSLHSDATGQPIDPTQGGSWTFYATEDERRLAETIHYAGAISSRSVYPEVRDRGVKNHWKRLKVLWDTRCPASLTEILFHTNPHERTLLKDPSFQQLVAEGFAEGVRRYFFAGSEGGPMVDRA